MFTVWLNGRRTFIAVIFLCSDILQWYLLFAVVFFFLWTVLALCKITWGNHLRKYCIASHHVSPSMESLLEHILLVHSIHIKTDQKCTFDVSATSLFIHDILRDNICARYNVFTLHKRQDYFGQAGSFSIVWNSPTHLHPHSHLKGGEIWFGQKKKTDCVVAIPL